MSFIVITNDGAPSRGAHSLWTGSQGLTGGAGEPGSGEFTGGAFWTPFDLLIKNFRRRVSTAPGVGTTLDCRVDKASTAIHLSNDEQINGTNTSVSDDMEVTIPAVVVTSNATILASMHWIAEWSSLGSPAASTSAYAFEYKYSTTPGVSFYGFGNDASGSTFSGTNSFAQLGATSMLSGTAEADSVTIWPAAGTIKNIALVWSGLAAATTIEVCLRKNGSDTAFLYSLSATSPTSNWQATVDTTTSVSVAAGDRLAWRIARTAGAGTSVELCILIGFQ